MKLLLLFQKMKINFHFKNPLIKIKILKTLKININNIKKLKKLFRNKKKKKNILLNNH